MTRSHQKENHQRCHQIHRYHHRRRIGHLGHLNRCHLARDSPLADNYPPSPESHLGRDLPPQKVVTLARRLVLITL